MKKIINYKVAKAALAICAVGTISFSSSLAFANETTTENNNLRTVELQTNNTKESVSSTETLGTNSQVTLDTKSISEDKVEEPTLIPGDFFYFAKLTIEKIKLIFTSDDVKEAELLAKFSSERLAEAESLFAQGKEELALETIQKALEDMEIADSVVKAETLDSNGEIASKDTIVEETSSTKLPTVEAPSNDEAAIKEIEGIISQNIIALTAAMEKVQNPKAKAALQKNIETSFAKLEKKSTKIKAGMANEEDMKESSVALGATEMKVEKDEVEVKVKTEINSDDDSIVTNASPSIKKAKAERIKKKEEVKKESKELKSKKIKNDRHHEEDDDNDRDEDHDEDHDEDDRHDHDNEKRDNDDERDDD